MKPTCFKSGNYLVAVIGSEKEIEPRAKRWSLKLLGIRVTF